MEKTMRIKCLLLAFLFLPPPDSSVVYSATELFISSSDNRIHTKIDSAYNLKNYGDVFELLDQEERIKDLKKKEALLDNLRNRLDTLMNKDDEDIDVEQVILETDKDCFRAGELYRKLNLFESVVLSLEAKGFRTRDYIRTPRVKPTTGGSTFPECNQPVENEDSTSELIIQTQGFINRRKLVATAEYDMDAEVTAGLSVNDYGAAVVEALKMNSTSWILLNMATFYYRMVGNVSAGLECSQRALHFSPRSHKDVALVSIASFFFRADYAEDALIALRSAIDISGGSTAAYSLMGFILASTSEFDGAVEAFTSALRVSKEEKKLNEYRYAVHCHAKVHRALSEQHRDLREIIHQFDQIGVLTKKMDALWSMVHSSRSSSSQALLHSYGRRTLPSTHSYHADGSHDFAFLNEIRKPLLWFNEETLHFSTRAEKFSKIFPTADYEFLDSKWPTPQDCELRLTRDIGTYRSKSVIIPWENKGFDFWSIVRRLHVTGQHPLPHCQSVAYKLPTMTLEMFNSQVETNGTKRSPDPEMERIISEYMGYCSSAHEFGRKIMLAQILNIMPIWMFFDMAAVYWRSIGDATQVAECYGRAFHSVPYEHRDVVHVGMTSYFRFMNMSNSSLFMMGKIAETNTKEPATLYTIGTILGFHGFLSLSVRNYKLALIQDISFTPAWEAFKNARCMQLLIAPTVQKNWAADLDRLHGTGKAGVIEIDIGIVELDLDKTIHVLKRTTNQALPEDFLDARYTEKLKKIASNGLKKLKRKKKMT